VFVLVFFASIVGFSLTMSLFLQTGLGFTPVHASFLLAAMAAGGCAAITCHWASVRSLG
jgi:hypothetical protein